MGGVQPLAPNPNFHEYRRYIAVVETFVQSTDDVVKYLKDQHNLIKDMFELSLIHISEPTRPY